MEDKTLKQIWLNKENSFKDYWIFQRLTKENKIRIFYLIEYNLI